MCSFEETVYIPANNKTQQKVSISVALIADKIQPVNSVFDTGAGLSIIQEDFLGAECLRAI